MESQWRQQLQPGAALRALVREATAALIVMDTPRLEELARCCAALNNDFQGAYSRPLDSAEMRSAADEVHLLGRVIVETRANLTVLSRLHAIRLSECCLGASEMPDRSLTAGRSVAAGEGANYGDH